jgi:hypothetical protein
VIGTGAEEKAPATPESFWSAYAKSAADMAIRASRIAVSSWDFRDLC